MNATAALARVFAPGPTFDSPEPPRLRPRMRRSPLSPVHPGNLANARARCAWNRPRGAPAHRTLDGANSQRWHGVGVRYLRGRTGRSESTGPLPRPVHLPRAGRPSPRRSVAPAKDVPPALAPRGGASTARSSRRPHRSPSGRERRSTAHEHPRSLLSSGGPHPCGERSRPHDDSNLRGGAREGGAAPHREMSCRAAAPRLLADLAPTKRRRSDPPLDSRHMRADLHEATTRACTWRSIQTVAPQSSLTDVEERTRPRLTLSDVDWPSSSATAVRGRYPSASRPYFTSRP